MAYWRRILFEFYRQPSHIEYLKTVYSVFPVRLGRRLDYATIGLPSSFQG